MSQYVKLARIIRDKIESREYGHGQQPSTVELTSEHRVSAHVGGHALEMRAENRYVPCSGNVAPYVVT
ncbi:hypothetical protein [Trebonia sp.]|uniref:hypothetical protein n=1 Tax=Trebonia sp. TaxID=2767075 RepID=UPI0026053F24|nr:hypothetical protein [Trebonia sp.]